MSEWVFQDPLWFWALLALPLIALLRRLRRVPVLVVPFAAEWHRPGPVSSMTWPAAAMYLGLALVIVALARPQAVEQKRETHQRGYDIVLAIDLSGSMYAEDFERGGRRVNRLQAVKPVIEAFINQRSNDRIGIVVFSGRAYTFAPLTFDHDWLRRQTGRLKFGLLERGTAIGDGLGVALSRLQQGQREAGLHRDGAFVVLLTDGANNTGAIDPREAARIAADRKIKVYTIGAGRDGIVQMPNFDNEGNMTGGYHPERSDLDEPLQRDIADKTGGKFFRATDSGTIERAFSSIDRAEKIEFEARAYMVADELFAWFAIAGLIFLSLAVLGVGVRPQEEALA
jgi:Ca-activated chloride channel family protein